MTESANEQDQQQEVVEAASSSRNMDANDSDKEPIEYNPRWKGYVLVALTSLLNFSSTSSVPSQERREYWIMSVAFGVTTFVLSFLILVQDRSQKFITQFHYSKSRDGYLEGYVLLFFVIWWFFGVAYITKPAGVAYVASNIYFSSWVTLFSCVYTLNEWSTEKDILSIAEITSISTTLKSWYIHWFSAIVVFSSSVHLHVILYDNFNQIQDTSFGSALGLVSLCISSFYIFVHYNFFTRCNYEEGGWAELFAAGFLILVWIIGISILTQDGGIGATMEGNQCYRDPTSIISDNCTIVLYLTDTTGARSRFELDCERLPRQIPGSNLYFACWACFLSALNLPFRWKAAQAMNFAHAREEKEQQEREGVEDGSDYQDNDNDSDDDYGDI
jgi:hypothetical protein